MAQELQFRALEKRRSSAIAWVLAAIVVAGVVGAVAWGLTRSAASDDAARSLAAAQAQVGEFQKALAERDRLLKSAHDLEDLLQSPGQAMGVFYRAAPDATESGVVVANPGQHAARFFLYGLVAPPTSGEYAAVARSVDGTRKVLSRILPDDMGDGFLLTRDVPPGTQALEVALRPAGHDGVQDTDIRISARYPTRADERGVLMVQQEQVQGRSGRKR